MLSNRGRGAGSRVLGGRKSSERTEGSAGDRCFPLVCQRVLPSPALLQTDEGSARERETLSKSKSETKEEQVARLGKRLEGSRGSSQGDVAHFVSSRLA